MSRLTVLALPPCLLLAGCSSTPARSTPQPPWQAEAYFNHDHQPGGSTTVTDTTANGLGRTARNLVPQRWPRILDGKRVFQRVWSEAAGASAAEGLGPLYNASSCWECHFKDGRGGKPSERDPDVRVLARLADPASGFRWRDRDPLLGSQLSEKAVAGLLPEGALAVTYRDEPIELWDGTDHQLRRPEYRVRLPEGSGREGAVAVSARVPGALVGMGLLEAIAPSDILAAADPDDRDGDGISGRANQVPDVRNGALGLGRFGWKAGQPSVEQQIATAFLEDMGLTSWLRPDSACTPTQRHCQDRDRVEEVSARDLASVVTYTRLLGVPARRPMPGEISARARNLFVTIGCASCHTPRQVTGLEAAFPELTRQVIFPYTDLLVHDMGPDLADQVSEFEASGREWRTAPLWGLGLLRVIHGRLRLLHDGRARSVDEAILWHGGEARRARAAYAALASTDRDALVQFVESL